MGEITENKQHRFNLIRLSALTGNKQFLPVIRAYAESEFTLGLPLLKWYEQAVITPDIATLFIQAMETAGMAGRHYQALLALALKKPLGIGGKAWQFKNKKSLLKLF